MKHRLLLIITALFLILNSCSFDSTEPDKEEFSTIDQKLYSNFFANRIIKTSDNCLLMAGNDTTYIPTIIKLDLEGNELWRTYTLPVDSSHFHNKVTEVIETSDNGYLVAFEAWDGDDSQIYKFDSEGNILWVKHLGVSYPLHLLVDQEDNIYLTDEVKIMKVDSLGEQIWIRYYYEDIPYTYFNVQYSVLNIYDFTMTYDNKITVIYSSPYCDLVRVTIDKDGNYTAGNYLSGEHYTVNIDENALIFSNWEEIFILGTSIGMDERSDLFCLEYHNYDYVVDSDIFDELNGFDDYIETVRETSDGEYIITALRDNSIIKFNPFNKSVSWIYDIDDIDAFRHPDSFDTVEITTDEYATILYVGRTLLETEFEGTALRFFKKN